MNFFKRINNKRGFSLLQFFVFIVILGIIIFVAVSLVKSYLANSRKKNFIITAENFVEQVKNDIVVAGGAEMEKGEKMLFSLTDLGVSETKSKSTYGNTWDFSKSYVIVENVGTDSRQRYEHYVALADSEGYCIPVSNVKDLNEKLVKEKDCNISLINQFDIKKVDLDYKEEIWKYRNTTTKIVFQKRILNIDNAIAKFDLSAGNNGMVMAYVVPNNNTKTHTIYIQSNGKILANKDSSYLFADFKKLETIEGIKYLDTSKVENMTGMFQNCRSLKELKLDTFQTELVKDFSYMFSNCSSLNSLDLSNFKIPSISKSKSMFSGLSELDFLDIRRMIFTKTDVSMFDDISTNMKVVVFDDNQKNKIKSVLTDEGIVVLTESEFKLMKVK